MLVAVHFAMGIYTLRLSPEPHIDVFYLHRESCNALLSGHNPYTATWPDIYGNGAGNLPGTVSNGRVVTGFLYPPVSLLCALAGHVLGDFRYAELAAMSITAILLGFSGKTQLSALAAALLLFTPRSFFVLEQGWTESFALMFLAATVFCFARKHLALAPVFLGLFLASKQHLFLTLPAAALLVGPPFRWKEYGSLLAKAGLAGGVVTMPFLLWNPHAFFHALLAAPLHHAFRPDSLTYMAWLSQHGVVTKLATLSLPASLVALGIGIWKSRPGPSGFASAVGLFYLVLFLLSDYAFCNYYYMVLGMFTAAVAAGIPTDLHGASAVPAQAQLASTLTTTFPAPS
jgi:hypothetical protein